MRIFIADDSTIFRTMLSESIAELDGLTLVGEAENALEAIDGIHKLKPDIVILDIRLRSGTGIDVLHAIKKSAMISPVAIVLSNHPYEQYRRASLNMGADYYFHKSTQYTNMITVLRGLLSPHSSDGPTAMMQAN